MCESSSGSAASSTVLSVFFVSHPNKSVVVIHCDFTLYVPNSKLFFRYWDLNSGSHACRGGAPPLEPICQSFFLVCVGHFFLWYWDLNLGPTP
jgi:hypothetical protein